MKKRILALVLSLSVLCSFSCVASAAENGSIQVQLDGQELTFPDAVPQAQDGYTFLPCRAVFEALGAEVSIEGSVITAQRGDTTLTMTIGETQATVTRDGQSETITMEVAPYVDSTTWRTYVPVRFAADAFGCGVGWDQSANTVVLVDVETLLAETLAQHEFTILEKLAAYDQQYKTGNWAMEAQMDMSAQLMGAQALVMDGTLQGITSATAAEAALAYSLDMTGLFNTLAAITGQTLEEMEVTESDLKMDLDMEMKMDLNSGLIYMMMGEALNEQMGLPADTWLSMDLGQLMAMSGMEWDLNELMNPDMTALLEQMLASVPLDGRSADGYDSLYTLVNQVADALCDESFVKTDTGYTNTLDLADPQIQCSLTLTLQTNSKDEVEGYAMDLSLTAPLDEQTQAALAAQGINAQAVSMAMTTAMDEDNAMTAAMQLGLDSLFSLEFNIDGAYAQTDELPDTTLPEDAQVVDYMQLLTAAMLQAGAAD